MRHFLILFLMLLCARGGAEEVALAKISGSDLSLLRVVLYDDVKKAEKELLYCFCDDLCRGISNKTLREIRFTEGTPKDSKVPIRTLKMIEWPLPLKMEIELEFEDQTGRTCKSVTSNDIWLLKIIKVVTARSAGEKAETVRGEISEMVLNFSKNGDFCCKVDNRAKDVTPQVPPSK